MALISLFKSLMPTPTRIPTPTHTRFEPPFEYNITRSKRKTMAIYVRNGKADVRAPLRAPKYWIEAFIQERSQWILQQIDEQTLRDAQRYSLNEGSTITYRGELVTVRLKAQPNEDQQTVELINNELFLPIFSHSKDRPNERKKIFNAWLKEQAAMTMRPLAHEYAERIGAENKLTKVRFRNTKTMWGHCTGQGVIQFNPLIMLAPEHVIHYLTAHEVCHLRHMNHSKLFWAQVESICPERKLARKWLRDNEHRLLGVL